MTAAVDLLRGLSYTGGLFGYAVMAYVPAAWVGDVVWNNKRRPHD